jgi:hypothetical protein
MKNSSTDLPHACMLLKTAHADAKRLLLDHLSADAAAVMLHAHTHARTHTDTPDNIQCGEDEQQLESHVEVHARVEREDLDWAEQIVRARTGRGSRWYGD